MRILFLLTQDLESPSGLGRYKPLARALVARGHAVQIATLHSNITNLESRKQNYQGVKIAYVAPMHVLKSGNQKRYYGPIRLLGVVLRATLALSWAALQTPTDVIYVGKPHPMNSIAGWLAKTFRRLPLIVDCDDYEAGSGHFSGAWQQKTIAFFEKRIPRQADAVTTHTHFMRENLISWGVAASKISYLPNGVDPSRFEPPDPGRVEAERARLGLHGKKVVAYIGSLSMPSHPVHLLVEAFARIRSSMPDTVLMIVGGGEELPNLKEQARRLEIEADARFVGRVEPEDIPLFYALADVSVDPVHDDPAARGRSPLKLFESWICGVPFVSANVGERADLLGDPPAGVLVEPDQIEGLAGGISKILSNSELADSLIRRGRERVENFYWELLAETLDQQVFSAIFKNKPHKVEIL